jgi:hypothetical protein
MDKQKTIQLIEKVKRQQRKDCTKSDLIKDKLFNVNQMADTFDKYLDWLIELVSKEKD